VVISAGPSNCGEGSSRRFDTSGSADEVWEKVVFEGQTKIIKLIDDYGECASWRSSNHQGWSEGKSFALTGWKDRFVCAARRRVRVAATGASVLTFTTAPNLKVAVAYGPRKRRILFFIVRRNWRRSRDRLTDGRESIGFPGLRSRGTYFLTVDLAPGT